MAQDFRLSDPATIDQSGGTNMLNLTDETPCADCPHPRGMHYISHDRQHPGCVACECDGFMMTPSKPQEPIDPELADRLAKRGMEVFREIVDRKDLEQSITALTAERDALLLQVGRYREALKIARHWMHIEADLSEFESFEFNRAQVDAVLSDPDAGAALLAAVDLLKKRWDQLTACVNEFEPEDMGACGERRDLLDDAILGVIRARFGTDEGERDASSV